MVDTILGYPKTAHNSLPMHVSIASTSEGSFLSGQGVNSYLGLHIIVKDLEYEGVRSYPPPAAG